MSLMDSCLRPELVIMIIVVRVFPVDDHGLFWVDKLSYELVAVFDVESLTILLCRCCLGGG